MREGIIGQALGIHDGCCLSRLVVFFLIGGQVAFMYFKEISPWSRSSQFLRGPHKKQNKPRQQGLILSYNGTEYLSAWSITVITDLSHD